MKDAHQIDQTIAAMQAIGGGTPSGETAARYHKRS
jgi:hypothetical protein